MSLEITTASDCSSTDLSFLTNQPFHIVIQVDSSCSTSILSSSGEEALVDEKEGMGKKGMGLVTGIRQWQPIYCSEVSDLTPYNNLTDHPFNTVVICV